MTYINQLFLILINLLVLVSCTSSSFLTNKEIKNESISIDKPKIVYEYKKLPNKMNIIYSDLQDDYVKNFIKGISSNYFYYKDLGYSPEINFWDLKKIKENFCNIQSKIYTIIFLNNQFEIKLSKDCLKKLLNSDGLLILFNIDKIKNTSKMKTFKVLREEDLINLLKHAKDQGSENSIIIDDEKTNDKHLIIKTWKSLEGKTINSSSSIGKRNEKLLSELLLIENSKSRSLKLSRILGNNLESTPRRRQDIDSLILSVTLSRARSLKPALEFNFGESLPVYLTSHWGFKEHFEEKEIDLDGITLVDMPWMMTKPFNDEKNKTRSFAVGYDAYELALLLNYPSKKRNLSFNGMTGKISYKQGEIFRKSPIVSVEKGKYRILEN